MVEFESDMFGEGLNEKIGHLENKYGRIGHGRESDEVRVAILASKTMVLFLDPLEFGLGQNHQIC